MTGGHDPDGPASLGRAGRAHDDGHEGDTALHRLPAETKILATLVFMVAVVVTPREAFWAFGVDLAVLTAVIVAARISLVGVVSRARIEIPFLAFALFLPVIGGAPRVDVAGLSLSEPGLWAAWNIAVKGTLGVIAATILASCTPVAELLRGLERLRAPRILVAIAGFMVRYLHVLTGEAERMRIARVSRGDDPRWLWQARATGASAGTLFVRSFERGERIHLAMLARGFDGTFPILHQHRAPASAWIAAAIVPLTGCAVALAALLTAT